MAKTTKVQEQSLESIMWNCRNALRGTVGGNEKNRDAVMGLVFLKFAGDKFDKRRAEISAEYGDIPAFLEKKSFYAAKSVYYLNETSRWSYIVKNASADDIAVEFIDHDLEIDYASEMARIQIEMREVLKAEKQSQAMLEAAFGGIGYVKARIKEICPILIKGSLEEASA